MAQQRNSEEQPSPSLEMFKLAQDAFDMLDDPERLAAAREKGIAALRRAVDEGKLPPAPPKELRTNCATWEEVFQKMREGRVALLFGPEGDDGRE